ncbi:hypothetical protein [Streptomyces sp. NPDC048172]|uniref:hypothetical protein n=1 Tax=Streptomyces sp. NPDC048172 TaxID=3365505 RepID=UPI00371A12CF
MIDASLVPRFTGNLSQLESDVMDLRLSANAFRTTGLAVHSRFQRLAGSYEAPEAEKLFRSTKPVADNADDFAAEVETVADALDEYASEVRPLVAKLNRLRGKAAAFEKSVEDDEKWTEDDDKVDEHEALRGEINATVAAFQAAEVACYNTIIALAGGHDLKLGNGSGGGSWTYGNTAGQLDEHGAPWGTPETETAGGWTDPLFWKEAGAGAKQFLWDGVIVGGAGGAIHGTWKLLTDHKTQAQAFNVLKGAASYGLYRWDGKYAPGWVKEGRAGLKDFGKAMVAWDDWKKNPAKASGITFFNVATLGSGALLKTGKAAQAGKLATVPGMARAGRVTEAAGKTGLYMDPMTHAVKGLSQLPKASSLLDGLRRSDTVRAADGAPHIPDDVVAVDPHGNYGLRADGSMVELTGAKRTSPLHEAAPELTATERAARSTADEPAVPSPVREGQEPALVGADHAPPNAVAHAGDSGPPEGSRGAGEASASGSQHVPGQGGDAPAGGGRQGSGASGGTPHQPASGGSADAARAADVEIPGQRPPAEQPSFMREGDNPYGPRGSLTREQIEEIQVYRANHEPGYREHYYRIDGTRRLVERVDESWYAPPQLTRFSEDGPWVRAKDVPAPPAPHFLDAEEVSVTADNLKHRARREILEEAAWARHSAIKWDNFASEWKTNAAKSHELHGTLETAGEWSEAKGTYREAHVHMRDSAEDFGEAVARNHYIAEKHSGLKDETLLGPANGNDRFDQVWTHEDGRVVVVEAKSSPTTELGRRTISKGRQVSQGSREYFLDIVNAMKKRGETDLARTLEKALKRGKLEYVLVKGGKNAHTYTGYTYRRFDISKGTLS